MADDMDVAEQQRILAIRLQWMEDKLQEKKQFEDARADLDRETRAAELRKELARIEAETAALDELAAEEAGPGSFLPLELSRLHSWWSDRLFQGNGRSLCRNFLKFHE